MKKFLLFVLAIGIAISSFAQYGAMNQKRANIVAPRLRSVTTNLDLPVAGAQAPNSIVSNKSIMDDPITAVTRFDLQSNSSNQNRIYYFEGDHTLGATTIWSSQDASYTDRGTGYNYFDGTAWGSQPTARVESIKTGWPSYLPFGATGELIISHQSTGPLVMNKRTTKGSGAWTQTILPALPSNITGMLWPRAVTNGADHSNIHIIALTMPTGNGGQTYNGMDGALLYCHSLDGGATFSAWQQLAGMTSAQYTSFTADVYAFAEPHGDTLAFTTGDSWQDQILMKSTDNGTTWTKTVIYHSPYNLGGTSNSFFYCPDGTMALALDNSGIAHVIFGLSQDSGTSTVGYYRPYTQGVAYWNEHMGQLDQSLNPDVLYASKQLAGIVKDTNVFYPPSGVTLATYYTSLTCNPEISIDRNNKVFVAWAGATLLVDPNNFTLRHIFGRDGVISGDSIMWHTDTLGGVDLTEDWIQYNFAECFFPSMSPTSSNEFVYLLFQRDDYGGSWGKNSINPASVGQQAPDDNFITVLSWMKPLWIGVSEKHEKQTFSVSQNFPNPVNGLTSVNVYLQNGGNLSLKVTNITGQTIMNMEKSNVLAGVSKFVVDGSQLTSGIYFYTVTLGDKSITKKMIVQ